ncbi:MAG: zinc-binding dehydrogenase [Planctomycetota bacterium]
MRAAIITEQGDPVTPNVRVVENHPEPPPPSPGEVTLRVLASALNHLDLWVGRGVPGLKLTYPRVSGCDACGEVIAVGEGVDDAWIGQRVIYNAAVPQPERIRPSDPPGSTLATDYALIGEHHDGAHRERFNLPASQLAPVGKTDPERAAAFGLTFLTAWSMMRTKGDLRPGQSVLITGIGGGVANAALAIANWLGCRACVTSRHAWKIERARELGVDHAVLDEGQDWSRDVRAWTAKRGVDMAVDSAGKATHLSCIKSLARGGAYVTPGCTSGPDATTDLARIFWNQLRILGSTMGSNTEFNELAALLRAGKLAPVIDRVYPAARAPEAFERIESGAQMGKVVIRWA